MRQPPWHNAVIAKEWPRVETDDSYKTIASVLNSGRQWEEKRFKMKLFLIVVLANSVTNWIWGLKIQRGPKDDSGMKYGEDTNPSLDLLRLLCIQMGIFPEVQI